MIDHTVYSIVPRKMISRKYIQNKLHEISTNVEHANKILERNEKLDQDSLLTIRQCASCIEDSCGGALEVIYGKDLRDPDYGTDDESVTFNFTGDYIVAKIPFTFKENWKVSKIFDKRLAVAIAKWERTNGRSIWSAISAPFVCLVERTFRFNHHTMADNDNLETSNVINRIIRSVGTDDNPICMHYAARFRKVDIDDEQCVVFYFVPCSYLNEHPEFLVNFFSE